MLPPCSVQTDISATDFNQSVIYSSQSNLSVEDDGPTFILEYIHALSRNLKLLHQPNMASSPRGDIQPTGSNVTVWEKIPPWVEDVVNGSVYLLNGSERELYTRSGVTEQVIAPTRSPYAWYTKDWPLLKQTLAMTIILSVAYIMVLLLGIVANALVVSVIYRNPQMRTVTNYFIANLAIADILVSIFVLPITLLHNLFTEWWYGSFVCKAAPYLQGVAVSASVNTLAAVAIERYLAIFYPQTSRMNSKAAYIIICIIWMVPMCIFVPWIVVYVQKIFTINGHKYVTCTADWKSMQNRKMYTLGAVFLTCYLIPLIFISIFYLLIGIRVYKRKVHGIRGSRAERNINRTKTRILRMLIVVFVIFALSWLPLYSVELRILFGSAPDQHERNLLKIYLVPFAQWLGAFNSCVNPFIYCYFSTNFRNGILQVVRSGTCCGKIST